MLSRIKKQLFPASILSLIALIAGLMTNPTTVVGAPPLILDITHEDDLSEYTRLIPGGGLLARSSAAALGDTASGLAVQLGGTEPTYGEVDFGRLTSPQYRFRFYLDPNALSMDYHSFQNIVALYDVKPSAQVWIALRYRSGDYQVRANLRDDAQQVHQSAWYAISDDEHYLEVLVEYASARNTSNGRMSVWVDGDGKEPVTGIDLFDQPKPEMLRLGSNWRIQGKTSGTYYLDEFVLRSDDSEIGPVSGPPGPQPTATTTHTPMPEPRPSSTSTPSPNTDNDLDFRHEAGLTGYDSLVHDGGDLSHSSRAALAGTQGGMQIIIDDNTPVYGAKAFQFLADATAYRFRHYVDPNGLSMTNSTQISLAQLYRGENRIATRLRYLSGRYTLSVRYVDDNGTWRSLPAAPIDDAEHYIEVLVEFASGPSANNGRVTYWVDDAPIATHAGLDLYDPSSRPDLLYLGAPWVKLPIQGTLYLDEFVLRDDDQYIGPVSSQPGIPTATLTTAPKPTSTSTAVPTPTRTSDAPWRPFAGDSPWNTPLGNNPPIDPNSNAYISQIYATQPNPRIGIAISEWTIPVYFIEDMQPYPPMVNVSAHSGWGSSLSAPIPPRAQPDPSADAHLCIIDRNAEQAWDFWDLRGSYPNYTSGTGRAISTNGSGVRPPYSHGCRESGFPLIAGLVRPEEIEAGEIRHALAYAFDARNGFREFVRPASAGADNHGSASQYVLPLGAQLQLRPDAYDAFLETDPPRGARIVARAMRDYGMYLGDENDNGSLGVYFENESTANWGALFGWEDRSALSGLEASDFRVIELPPIGGEPPANRTPVPTTTPENTPNPTTTATRAPTRTPAATNTPQRDGATVIDHRHVDASQLSAAEKQRAAGLVTFFNHKSVGNNILDHIGYWGSIAVRHGTGNQPGINEYEGGWNADYAAKLDSFESINHSGHDIAMQKFCFVEFPPWLGSTGPEVWNAYRASMARMQAQYPRTTFVYWTAPVHTTHSPQRTEFNRLVREYIQTHGEVLFDIADMESDGGRCGHDAMCPEYTDDGGHLNTVGGRRVAGALWVLLARVAE